MKRKILGAAAAVLVLCAGTGSVLALGSSGQEAAAPDMAAVAKVCTGPCGGTYTDENADGICDYCAARQGGAGCRNACTDADGDGVCDNYPGQARTGGRHRHGQAHHGCSLHKAKAPDRSAGRFALRKKTDVRAYSSYSLHPRPMAPGPV